MSKIAVSDIIRRSKACENRALIADKNDSELKEEIISILDLICSRPISDLQTAEYLSELYLKWDRYLCNRFQFIYTKSIVLQAS